MEERNIDMIKNPYKMQRDMFPEISDFINGNECYDGKVLVIYGLRRTGKTTMMEQYISNSPLKDRCAFFEIEKGDTVKMIEDCIDEEENRGKNIIFFDEITKAEDFISNSAALADIYAKDGIKVILTGTDSIGFYFAEKNELFDRTVQIHTSYIPFAEHCRIFGTNDMDDYIKFGGLMKQGADRAYIKSYEDACRYLDEAVAGNIANSLQKNPDQTSLNKLSKDEIATIIEKMVEIYSGRFNIPQIQEELKTASVTYPINKLPDLNDLVEKSIIRQLNRQKADMVKEFLPSINADKRIETEITEPMVEWLIQYLREMGVLSTIQHNLYIKNEDNVWTEMPKDYQYHIVQPAIKYYHLKEGKKFIEESPFFLGLSEKVKSFMEAKLEEQILGLMTEEIVLFDVTKSLSPDKYIVCKPEFELHRAGIKQSIKCEYDMLIYNREDDNYYAFEIKHSMAAVEDQSKHLKNTELKEIMDEKWGNRKNVSVLYRGDPFWCSDGIYYLNITDFLLAVDKYKSIENAMESLSELLGYK